MDENEKQIITISTARQAVLFLLSAPVLFSLSSIGAFPAVITGSIISYIALKIKKKKFGFVWPFLLTAGIMTAVTAIPYIGKVSSVLLIISGAGLLAFGIVRLVQYLLERK
jgi:hypothetical protein